MDPLKQYQANTKPFANLLSSPTQNHPGLSASYSYRRLKHLSYLHPLDTYYAYDSPITCVSGSSLALETSKPNKQNPKFTAASAPPIPTTRSWL